MKNKILLLAIALLPLFTIAQDTLQTPLEFIQEMPTYPGGEGEMYNVILKNIKYPEFEKALNIEGTVFVNLVVEKDGTPTHFKVTLGVNNGPGLNAEALKVCQKLGKFNPGRQNGVPQRVYLTIPVEFSLADDGETGITKEEMLEIQMDANYLCEGMFELVKAKKEGDTEKFEKLRKVYDVEADKIYKKYIRSGAAKMNEIERLCKPCYEEATKAAMEE